jgi:AraC-like DNA-binding protein
MKPPSKIRQHFIPVQPAVKGVENNVAYREMMPDTLLQPFIYCYWDLKSSQYLSSPFTYKVIPDGCIDIYFPIDEPDQSFVMGFCNQYVEYSLGHTFHYAGIRFLPTVFTRFFGISADELNNRFETLDNVVPEIASYIANHISPDSSLPYIKRMLDHWFLNHLTQTEVTGDPRVTEAVRIILENSGTISIERDLNTGLSRRQLRRLFKVFVGGTPKSFSKVVRFQHILKEASGLQHLKQSSLLYNAGYYDQAHFINEFRSFYGESPGRVFGHDPD